MSGRFVHANHFTVQGAIDYLNSQLRRDMRVNATPRHQRVQVQNNIPVPESIGSLGQNNLDRLLTNMDQIINDESSYERTRERYHQGGYQYFQNLPYQQTQSEYSKSLTRRLKKQEKQKQEKKQQETSQEMLFSHPATTILQAPAEEPEDPAIVWMGQKTKPQLSDSSEVDDMEETLQELLQAVQQEEAKEDVEKPKSNLQHKGEKEAKEYDRQKEQSPRISPVILDVEKHFKNLTDILEEKAEEIILEEKLKKFDFVIDDQEEISKFEKENSISNGIKRGIIDKLIGTNERQLMNLAKVYIKCGHHDTADILKEFSPENCEKMYQAAQQMAKSMNCDQESGHNHIKIGHNHTRIGHNFNKAGHNFTESIPTITYINEIARIPTQTGHKNTVCGNSATATGQNNNVSINSLDEAVHNITETGLDISEPGHNSTKTGHTYKDQEDDTPEEDLEIFENLFKSMNGDQPEEESYKVIEEMMANWKRIEREEEIRRLLKQKREVDLQLEKLTQALKMNKLSE